MSLKLRELIKKVRSCKTAEEERSIINKESADIRNMNREQSDTHKVRNLAKSIFMHMLGYPTNFIHMTCVNLLASTKFTDKRIAYVGLCVLMDEKSEVILLTSHTIKKDLENPNQYIVGAALNSIGEICTPDMCRDSITDVLKCLANNNPYIKKKAALALTKIIKKCPEMIDTVADKLKTIFEDKNHGVFLSGLTLAIQIFKADPSYIGRYKKYIPHLIRYLKNLSTTNYAPEYDINGITDPFLQVRILEVLAHFGKVMTEENEDFENLLASISTNTDSNKNTGNSVLYELVRTIISNEASSGLKALSSTILGKFLGHKDNNYKYIALNTLQEVAKTDINSVQKHKNTILECLKDNDISIKRRSLDLVYLIINSSNIKQIIKECLNLLLVAENELKTELTWKISQSLEKYSPSLKWQVDTLIKMLCLAGNFVNEETTNSIINLIIRHPEIHLYSAFKLYIAMKSNMGQEGLIRVGVYVLGEHGHLLVNNSALGPDNETITITENDVVQIIQEISQRKNPPIVKEYVLNCCVKLISKFSSHLSNQLRTLIEDETRSYYCEVQERATEYMIFNNIANEAIKKQIVKQIPVIAKEEDVNRHLIVDDEDPDGLSSLIGKERSQNLNNGTSTKSNQTGSNNLFETFGDIFQSSTFTPSYSNLVPTLLEPSVKNLDQDIKTSNGPSGIDLLSELGKVYANQGTTTTTPSVTNVSTNVFDLISLPLEMNKPVNFVSDTQPLMKEIFRNGDISILCSLNKTSDNVNVDGAFYASNNTSSKLINVKINFSVKNTLIFKVLSTSGNVLEPSSSLGIKKEVTITNTNPQSAIVILVSFSYNIDEREVKDSFKYEVN